MNQGHDPRGGLVCIVDDEELVRESLKLLVESQGVDVRAYGSCLDFLEDPESARCACLILDVRLPGMSGLQLQQRLSQRRWVPAIIMMSGHADVPMAVQAMRDGALDFLQKPFPEQVLLDRVSQALDMAAERQRTRVQSAVFEARRATLTTREREVMDKIVAGLPNKLTADELRISIKTVEQHRAKVMEKMRVSSVAELVKVSEHLQRGE
jgi:FixJ family two-component response regulator